MIPCSTIFVSANCGVGGTRDSLRPIGCMFRPRDPADSGQVALDSDDSIQKSLAADHRRRAGNPLRSPRPEDFNWVCRQNGRSRPEGGKPKSSRIASTRRHCNGDQVHLSLPLQSVADGFLRLADVLGAGVPKPLSQFRTPTRR